MDRNNEQLGLWVERRLSALNPDDCKPDVDTGLARLKTRAGSTGLFSSGWTWAVSAAAVICLFLIVRPSPAVIVHKCIECSAAVWQTISSSGSSQTGVQPVSSRNAAPDFRLTDEKENVVSVSGLKGKVVLVNFWATWCHGCQVEIPRFIEFQKVYRDRGLVVVGVSMDEDGWKSVRPWVQQKKPNYSIVIGNETLGKQFRLDGMPRTVLIDRAGRIAATHSGVVDKGETESAIRTLLNENP